MSRNFQRAAPMSTARTTPLSVWNRRKVDRLDTRFRERDGRGGNQLDDAACAFFWAQLFFLFHPPLYCSYSQSLLTANWRTEVIHYCAEVVGRAAKEKRDSLLGADVVLDGSMDERTRRKLQAEAYA
ncbi:hypothetical protein BKA62DRAFT_829072 [Auriculariales sp. MPI-PUGE-AT-0066]|nr:hypothetical protein BKA62DRAFT_829072 [Auriculariales sp. MPI-PUGE-AT-0066]